MSDPHGQGGAGVGFDLHSGQFNYQFTYTIADLHLEHLEGHWGSWTSSATRRSSSSSPPLSGLRRAA